jgi:hypothetical protein
MKMIGKHLGLAWLLILILGAHPGQAQEIWFFREGTDATFYDQGIVNVSGLNGSLFEYTFPPGLPQYNDKVPCSTTAYAGSTSLKFNYTSNPGGNWKAKIFRSDPAWSTADISGLDSLSFQIYSSEGMPASALPLIGLHASNASGSGEIASALYPLSGYNSGIPAGKWTRVVFPLSVIMDDAANASLDFTEARAVVFGQSESDGSSRVFLADEIAAFKALGEIPAPEDLSVTGYDSHADLRWTRPLPDLSYKITASFDGGSTFLERGTTSNGYFLDFVSQDERNKTVTYRVVTINQGSQSTPVEQEVQIRDFSDEELMDMVQRYAFDYFWDGAHSTGMALERSNGSKTTAASGATGMGLMAMIVACERGYRPVEEIKDRILLVLDFLETCDRHHGAWSHWYNADTKKTQPFSTNDDGGDLVETSYVTEGLLALKHYFTGEDAKSVQIREKADQLWKEVEWDWYRKNGENTLYWHWSPNVGWAMNMQVRGWNETLVTYLMAASSPTHGVPKEVYTHGYTRDGTIFNRRRFYERDIYLSPNWGGPLFFIHYTHLGVDPYGLYDGVVNYWVEYVNTSMIHYLYAIENPLGHESYGEQCWGLTASDDPDGYTAHRPWENDNGTVSPTAALSSMPYTPAESMKALKYFYRERGKDLFGIYGPYDAFNDDRHWVQEAYIGIDQGPIVDMIENHRSRLLWETVMKDEDLQAGMAALGFTYVPVGIDRKAETGTFGLYPNPAEGEVWLRCPDLDMNRDAEVRIFSSDGRMVKAIRLITGGQKLGLEDLGEGLYLVRLLQGDSAWYARLEIIAHPSGS